MILKSVNIESRQVGDRVILQLAGRMDADNAPAFETQCESWILKGINQLVIDVGDLAYVSSMGLRSFLTAAKAISRTGGRMPLAGMKGLVKEVFDLTNLTALFPQYESVEAALASL